MITVCCRSWIVPSFRLGASLRALTSLVFGLAIAGCTVEASEATQTASTDQPLAITVNRQEPRICCQAMIASCLACRDGVTVQQYCARNPETVGCTRPVEPRPTCNYNDPARHYVARSPAQCARIRFYCADDQVPFSDECGCGCQAEPRACCQALTASCLACSAGQSVQDYCLRHPETFGCNFCMHSGECEGGEYCTTEDGVCLRKPGSMLTVCYGLCSSNVM